MADSSKKIILVTGATDGIGKETVKILASAGHLLILHGRTQKKADRAVEEIREKKPFISCDSCFADLSSLEEIKGMVEKLYNTIDRLDILINNAGIFETRRKTSKDGYELTFAVNHLAYFYLTGMLLPLIKKSVNGRIINVASMAHASVLDFNNLQHERHYEGYTAYALSKLCNIMYTYELAERLEGTGITVNCLHPGVINTKLLRKGFRMGGADVATGAETPVWLAISEEIQGISGRYFANKSEKRSSAISYDKQARLKLWEISERLTGIKGL